MSVATQSSDNATDETNTTVNQPVIDYSLLEEPHEMAWGAEARALTGQQKFLVIDAKWPNHANSRWSNAELDNLFDNTISDFFADASHNQITIAADVFSITMPDDSDQYLKVRDDGTFTYDTKAIVRDALDTVDPQVDLNNYPQNEVIVILNGPWYNGVFWSASVSGLDENNGDWPFIVVSENDGKEGTLLTTDSTAPYNGDGNRHSESHNRTWGRISHEIGHMLGLSHTTKDYNNSYALLASLMPGQLTGYSMRAEVDWLPDSRVYQPAPGTLGETVFLYPLEMGNVGEQYQLIKIPITDQKYYLIEVRSRVLADKYMHCTGYNDVNIIGINEADECIAWGFNWASLPDEGVLVSFVDLTVSTSGQNAQAVTIDLDDDGSQDSLLKSGDSLVIDLDGKDASIDIVGVQPNGAYEIKVSYEISDLTPPDIWMPENPPWKVAEIWVDSPLNGMGLYQYHDGDPTVPNAGNGDNPWLGHQNSICARVRNTGQLPSNSVPVTFKWKTHNMGLPSDSFAVVGTVNTASIAGGSYEDVCVTNWIPEVEGIEYDPSNPIVSVHACIRAEVGLSVDDPNTANIDETETNTGNNEAQENIGHFETTSSSPFHPINLTFTVGNPSSHDTWIWLEVSNVPNNWQYSLAWLDDTISPNAEVSNTITITPPATMTGAEMRLIHDIEITGYYYRAEPDGSTHVAELGSVIASVSPADVSQTSLNTPICAQDFTGICTVTGAVDGGLIGTPVTVIYTSPNGVEYLSTTNITDQNGFFTDVFSTSGVVSDPEGDWTALAVYLGGTAVEGSSSDPRGFFVDYRGSTSVRDDRTDITANESHTFTDLVENGEPGSSVVIKFISPSEKVFEVETTITDEGTFSVRFSPTEAGEWTIKYTYGGNEVSSTFEVKEESESTPSIALFSTLSIVAMAAILTGRRQTKKSGEP